MSAPTDRPERAGAEAAAVRLLVVEDDAGHVEAIRRAFERAESGTRLTVARTLAEFRRASEAGQTDLALVDLNLPDGQALEILTVPPEEGAFPVLVMTSFGNEQIAAGAIKAGALDYVVKAPESFAGMPRTVERALGQWRVLQERRQAERRNRQLTRVYRLLSAINEAIVRVRDLDLLFSEACRIAIEAGGFRAAWIGLLEPGSARIAFSRRAGPKAEGAVERGPAASVLERGGRSVCNDVRTDVAAAAWREKAIANGVLSWAALPLSVEGAVVGAFCLCSGEAGTFDTDEVALLDEMAMDLSFAVEMGRREAARAEAEAEIERLNASLEAKVRERTAELEAANRELESFSYSVSHDLRSPLRTIDGFSQILVEDHGDRMDEAALRLVQKIRAGVRKMGGLVDGLLALSRLGRATLKREPLDLGRIASEVDAGLRASFPERRVEFVAGEGMSAVADPNLVEALLQNVLGNAWKFTSKNPVARIEMGVEREGNEAVFFVRDDGAGFDGSRAGELFQPFQRLHRTEEFEGTGIGLALVRRIAQRHGGRVSIEGAVGRGAAVRFTLPDRPDRPEQGEPT